MEIKTLDSANSPASLQIYFTQNPSARISYIGNIEILSDEKIGFFCSSKASGAAILKVFERANLWRKERTTIIGGFHSPLEREVLEILLKGKGRIIISPARSLETMRLPQDWLTSFTENRLLIISPFAQTPRVSRTTAAKRNRFVAQIADRIVFGYISDDSKIEKFRQELAQTKKAFEILDC
jgi:predicted Rossmann fold nucleotide-binding protein DprA/Smf involved in DNA uptake